MALDIGAVDALAIDVADIVFDPRTYLKCAGVVTISASSSAPRTSSSRGSRTAPAPLQQSPARPPPMPRNA